MATTIFNYSKSGIGGMGFPSSSTGVPGGITGYRLESSEGISSALLPLPPLPLPPLLWSPLPLLPLPMLPLLLLLLPLLPLLLLPLLLLSLPLLPLHRAIKK